MLVLLIIAAGLLAFTSGANDNWLVTLPAAAVLAAVFLRLL